MPPRQWLRQFAWIVVSRTLVILAFGGLLRLAEVVLDPYANDFMVVSEIIDGAKAAIALLVSLEAVWQVMRFLR